MSVISGSWKRSAMLHQPQRLAIALRLRHAVVAAHALLRVAPLLLPDDHHWLAFEPAAPPTIA